MALPTAPSLRDCGHPLARDTVKKHTNLCVSKGFSRWHPDSYKPRRQSNNTTEREKMNIANCQRSTLTAWPGFVRFTSLNDDLSRLFENQNSDGWIPAFDVYEDKDCFVVQAELPGLKRENIEVSLHDGTLTITGERKPEPRPEGAAVYRAERRAGRFQRAVVLPATVAADKVTAGYLDGVLTVTLPKTEEARPKKIDVSVN